MERISAKDERELLEWISPIPYGKHHTFRAESRTHGTCEWLLQDEDFCEWRDYQSSAVLWLQGSSKRTTVIVLDFCDANLVSGSREDIPHFQGY